MKPVILNPNFATTRMIVENNYPTVPLTSESKIPQGGLRTKGYDKRSSPENFLPLVTIITVVYNNDLYLEETINSVINQSYDNLEYIIIDGGSTDRTLEIIRQYEAYIDYWISESDRGLYDAMNKGIALAKGELVGILNSDDLYMTTTVEQVVNQYQNALQPCVIYGSMYKFASPEQPASLHPGDLSDRAFQTASIAINHPTCFVHRQLYQTWGGFNLEYEVGADRELMMRLHRQQVPFINLSQAIAKFRLGGTTSNQSLNKIINRELLQEYKLLANYQFGKVKIATVLGKKFLQSFRKWIFYQVLGEKLTNQIIMFYVSRKFPQKQ